MLQPPPLDPAHSFSLCHSAIWRLGEAWISFQWWRADPSHFGPPRFSRPITWKRKLNTMSGWDNIHFPSMEMSMDKMKIMYAKRFQCKQDSQLPHSWWLCPSPEEQTPAAGLPARCLFAGGQTQMTRWKLDSEFSSWRGFSSSIFSDLCVEDRSSRKDLNSKKSE